MCQTLTSVQSSCRLEVTAACRVERSVQSSCRLEVTAACRVESRRGITTSQLTSVQSSCGLEVTAACRVESRRGITTSQSEHNRVILCPQLIKYNIIPSPAVCIDSPMLCIWPAIICVDTPFRICKFSMEST